jgi:shikimate dehydrogenase
MELNIRKAVASDYADLCPLFEEGDALHREHLPHIFQKPSGAVRGREYVLGLIANEAVGFFVAHAENQLVGLICVMLRQSPEGPIFVQRRYAVVDNVVVQEGFRHAGIGRELMEKAHEWAMAAGVESIELNVWEFNQDAIAFYKTLGYETISRKIRKRPRSDY